MLELVHIFTAKPANDESTLADEAMQLQMFSRFGVMWKGARPILILAESDKYA